MVHDHCRELVGNGDCLEVLLAIVLADHNRLGTHLDDQRLRNRQRDNRCSDCEIAFTDARQVNAGAGESHCRVNRERNDTLRGCRAEDVVAVLTRGVCNQLPRAPHAVLGDAVHGRCDLVCRNGEQDEVCFFKDGRQRLDRNVRQ